MMDGRDANDWLRDGDPIRILSPEEAYGWAPLTGQNGQRPRLPLLRFADWQDRPIPERRWIVPDWIPSGQVSALYGDGGTGKSLLAQQLMAACATGTPWLGISTTRCQTIGLLCEDDDGELLRRQCAINAAAGLSFRDLGDMATIAGRLGADNALMVFGRDGRGEVTELWRQFRAAALDFRARLAVVDTAADTFGGDEINRAQVRQFVSVALGALARDIDGAVLLCAHPSVRGMADGSGTGASTAWSNTVRSRLYLARPDAEDGDSPDPNVRVLSRRKANYASTGDELRLRWEHGVFRIDGPAGAGGGMVEAIDAKNRERWMLDAVMTITQSGQPYSTYRTQPSYVPNILAQLPDRPAGCGKRTLAVMFERAVCAGTITTREVYNPQKGRALTRITAVNGINCEA